MVLSVVAGWVRDRFAEAWTAFGALGMWWFVLLLAKAPSGHTKTMGYATIGACALGCVVLIGHALVAYIHDHIKAVLQERKFLLRERETGRKWNIREQTYGISGTGNDSLASSGSHFKLYFNVPAWNRADIRNRD